MKVLFTRSARRQIAAILAEITAHSPRGALNVRARIEAVTSLLGDHPHLGRRTDVEGVRRVTVVPYPYLVFYRVVADAVIIQLVRHAARGPSTPADD